MLSARIDAPGLEIRPRADGSFRLLWRAPKWVRRAGYPTASVAIPLDIRDPATHPLIVAACRREDQAAREWHGARITNRPDGTIAGLSRLYQTHEASPFHRIKHSTRRLEQYELRMIEAAWGARRLDALDATAFHRWYRQALDSVPGEGTGGRKAHGLIKRVRAIVKFGVVAEVAGCARLHAILSAMRFEQPASRKVALSYDQAAAIIAKAHALGRPSIALAQALQFETGLRQIDVIGQWEPCAPDDASPWRTGLTRWAPGLVWQMIDRDLVLRIETSKTGAVVTHALGSMPLVAAELARIPKDRRVGPLVVNENTGQPYLALVFSRNWRKIARAAGIPDTVWNRDSRAGALTEGDEAGVSLGELQRMAGHTTPKVTGRYVRGRADETSAKIADMRSARRTKRRQT